MTKRGGLGRGLAALIPTSAPVAEPAPDTEEATGESGAASSPPAVSLVPAPPSTFPFSSPSAPPALPAAARGVRRYPRGAGHQDRSEPLAGDQHDPADEAAREGADARRGRRHLRRSRAGTARPAGRRRTGRPGHPDRRRGHERPRHRG